MKADHSEPIVLILAGGRGERFWPRSRRECPKQLQRIYSSKTLLEETLERARLLTVPERIFIGCDPHLKKAILKSYSWFSISRHRLNFIVEPQGRNTAPMIALAALKLEKRFPGTVQVVMPADQYINPPEVFCDTLRLAIQTARSGFLVTLGISPERPDSQYGYIHAGKGIQKKGPAARHILAFKEKPDSATAKAYLSSGHYFWNSGIFVWTGERILDEFQEHAPEILKPLQAALRSRKELRSAFAAIPKLPVDIAILEKSSRAAVIPANFRWDDLGSWNSLRRVLRADSKGNFLFSRKGTRLASLESTGNIIAVDRGLVALLGLRDIVVVEEEGILFLAHQDALARIKEFLEQMRKNA